MLCGLTLNHYYINLKNIIFFILFDQICNAIYNYFKGLKYKRGILKQWNLITLKSIIGKGENTRKLTLNCLQLLIKELKHFQYSFNLDLYIDKFLYNKLINAY